MTVSIKVRPLQYSHTVGMLALTGRGFSNPMDRLSARRTPRLTSSTARTLSRRRRARSG